MTTPTGKENKLTTFRHLLILLIFSVAFSTGCQGSEAQPKEMDLLHIESTPAEQSSKKVIFVVVDSLMSQALEEGIKRHELPTFQWLIEHGQYYPGMVSSFPTMSVTIDSSLLTGTYPNQHMVPGLIWYSKEEGRVVNYGTGFREIVKGGVNPMLNDAFTSLNQSHLSKQQATIFEELAERGYTSGGINGLIYRGKTEHTLSIPTWLHGSTVLPKQIQVKGPDFLSFGVFSNPLEGIVDLPDGVTKELGFNNEYSLEVVKYLVKTNRLPDFLYVYLPDMDQQMHKDGPPDLEGVKKVDQQIFSLLESFGSLEAALEEVILIFIGDSGQTKILGNEEEAVVKLENFLQGYNVLPSGAEVSKETEIILAVNERMAYVYTLSSPLQKLVALFQKDPRLDLIAWQEKGWIHVHQGETGQALRYKPKGNARDEYGQSWQVEGNLEVLDLQVGQDSQNIKYGEYPDGLHRLWAALNSHPGEYLVLTAKPGYELAAQNSPKHLDGGGHGSLHQTDSLVPLIITGTEENPEHIRLVNLKDFILKLLTKEGK